MRCDWEAIRSEVKLSGPGAHLRRVRFHNSALQVTDAVATPPDTPFSPRLQHPLYCAELRSALPGCERIIESCAPADSFKISRIWIERFNRRGVQLRKVRCRNTPRGIPTFSLDSAEAKVVIGFHAFTLASASSDFTVSLGRHNLAVILPLACTSTIGRLMRIGCSDMALINSLSAISLLSRPSS